MSYPMTDDSRCRLVPDADCPSLTEYEPDVISAAIGLYLHYTVRYHEMALPTADEWARAHAAYDAAILGGEPIPEEAELYGDVLRDIVGDLAGASFILSYEDHTITIGEGPDRRRVPLPAAVAEDGRQITAMLLSGSPMASGLTSVAMAEGLRSWLAPLARYARGIHRECIAQMYGD